MWASLGEFGARFDSPLLPRYCLNLLPVLLSYATTVVVALGFFSPPLLLLLLCSLTLALSFFLSSHSLSLFKLVGWLLGETKHERGQHTSCQCGGGVGSLSLCLSLPASCLVPGLRREGRRKPLPLSVFCEEWGLQHTPLFFLIPHNHILIEEILKTNHIN